LSLKSTRELEHRAQPWRPWRAYAAMYLWRLAAEPAARVRNRARSTSPS
jgi:3-methyladenine DNA glycosylase/8-oxoguanine DNA glycosylase